MNSKAPASSSTLTVAPERSARAEDRTLLVYGPGTSLRVALPLLGEIVFGRASTCDVTIDDSSISRSHARVSASGDGVFVEDLGSHNGTHLNGERITGRRRLSPGDLVEIGTTSFLLVEARRAERRRVLDALGLADFLREQVERAQREPHVFAVLSVVAAEAGGPADRAARVAEQLAARWLGDHDALALGPGDHVTACVMIDEESADERAAACLAALGPDAALFRMGVAEAPSDGLDALTLLHAARAAADAAPPGAIERARNVFSLRRFGGVTVLLADPAMLRAYALIERLARGTMPILIRGETGVGKELAAAAVHALSPRSAGPFRAINCAALTDTLIESELFGHERGAFTGAVAMRRGILEQADGGTLFLDEVGELTASAQAKLLRVVESGVVTRVGGATDIAIDVRIVGATHRDLGADAQAGRFRADLYYRIGVAAVELPALRERPREIALLAREFVAKSCARTGRDPIAIAPLTLQALISHDWPGNVRELRNVLEYAVAVADGAVIQPRDLPPLGFDGRAPQRPRDATTASPPPPSASAQGTPAAAGSAAARASSLTDELRELERTRIIAALTACDGVQARAAAQLGIPVRTLFAKLRAYAIDAKTFATKRAR